MGWTYFLADRNGNVIDELAAGNKQVSQRTVRFPLNRVPTAGFLIRRDNPYAARIRDLDKLNLLIYDPAKALRFLGPLVSYNKAASEQNNTIQVNAAGIGWRLSRRQIPSSQASTGVTYTNQDRGTTARAIINEVNTLNIQSFAPGASADTGIRYGSGPFQVISNTTYGPVYYKNSLDAIGEIAAPLDGFDWKIDPLDPVTTPRDALGQPLGMFTAVQSLGSTRPDTVFQYGGDEKVNVVDFTEAGDASQNANRVFSLPPDFPNSSTSVAAAVDPDSILTRGLYEDMAAADISDITLRTKLAQENVKVRKIPRYIMSFDPVRNLDPNIVPVYGTDYVEGDAVTFRAVEYGRETIDILMRVYVADISIDDEGNPTVKPTLISEDVSSPLT